jgi:hypothetical protein
MIPNTTMARAVVDGLSDRESITYAQYLQLLGLFVLGKKHNEDMRAIEAAAAEIVGQDGDDGYYGHVSDELADSCNVDAMLSRLGIIVVKS